MNSNLLARANKVIPDQKLLVNIIRLRVRQLGLGNRPLIAAPPGMGLADIALSEVAEGKLTSAPTDETKLFALPASKLVPAIAAPREKKAA